MYSESVVVSNESALYANPATLFIAKANSFKSAVLIEKGDRKINGKSLLGILSMGITGGTEITISAEGADQELAVDTLCAMVENGLEE